MLNAIIIKNAVLGVASTPIILCAFLQSVQWLTVKAPNIICKTVHGSLLAYEISSICLKLFSKRKVYN